MVNLVLFEYLVKEERLKECPQGIPSSQVVDQGFDNFNVLFGLNSHTNSTRVAYETIMDKLISPIYRNNR